ncbi:MAG: tyrosinase family protein [Deltaproteobacteria bacterium]|nr:tyrosinase family protein [Deltaproteobacteria bacterium]
MTNITRRSFLAAGVASVLSGLSATKGFGGIKSNQRRYIRYNVNSPQGQMMLDKFAKAVEIMRGTPPDFKDPTYPDYDPHSWTFQWFTHWTNKYQAFQYQKSTDYKAELIDAFPPGAPKAPAQAMWNSCQAHGINPDNPEQFQEWFFPPWHRLYLYHFEQIVRNVLNDSSFSLPYWDAVADPTLPAAFRDSSSALYDERYTTTNAGVRLDNAVLSPNWLSVNCLNELFYIDSPTGSFGFCTQVDINPHFTVHVALGGDMSNGFNTAANDPIFWPHHANIDRLWESWNRLGGHNPKDPKWLDRAFTFADANGNLVQVPVSAATRVSQLGYSYDNYAVPPKLVKFSQQELEKARAMPQVTAALGPGGVTLGAGAAVVPLTPVAAMAEPTAMPLARRVQSLAPGRQLYLILKELQAKANPNVLHGLYFDLPQGATPSGANDPHFVGGLTFSEAIGTDHTLHDHVHGSTFAFNITETLQKLNANKMLGATANAITIVPTGTPAAHAEPIIGQIAVIEL